MDLFYLKNSLSDLKTPEKRQKLLSSSKNLLTTNPFTKQTTALKSLKLLTNTPLNPRIFNESKLFTNPEEISKLEQIRQNIEKLSQYKYLLSNSQGEIDELMSRIQEQQHKLIESSESTERIRSDLQVRSAELTESIIEAEKTLEINQNNERGKNIELASKEEMNLRLKSETASIEAQRRGLLVQEEHLQDKLHSLSSEIIEKTDLLEPYKAQIQLLLIENHYIHSFFQEDEISKEKLREEIKKFENIKKQ